MWQKYKQKQILNRYKHMLAIIKQSYNISLYLTLKQKQALDKYTNRCIAYCSSLKSLQNDRKYYTGQDVISNINQYYEYKIIYRRLLNLTSLVASEIGLVESYRNELLKLLGQMQGHILGKLNCNAKRFTSSGESGQV